MRVLVPYLKVSSVTFDKLFTFSETRPLSGNPSWMNIKFYSKALANKNEMIGPGIYAGFFDGELIYIGKFLGLKDQPFSGNIIDTRWIKHLGTMTLRAHKISYTQRGLSEILNLDLIDEVSDIRKADPDLLKRDRGLLSTKNRFVFGMEHWDDFRSLSHETLNRFNFVYVRLINHDIGSPDISSIRAVVSEIEAKMVGLLEPRCNAVIKSGPLANRTHPDDFATLIVNQYALLIEPYKLPQTYDLIQEEITQKEAVNECAQDKGICDETNALEPYDPELSSSEAKFIEQFDDDPNTLGWIQAIRGYFENESSIEVHFKKHSPADMRIRVDNGFGKGRNVFTLEWKSRKREFLCRSLASDNQFVFRGVNEIRHTGEGEPLRTEFRVSPESTSVETMETLIRQAIVSFNH